LPPRYPVKVKWYLFLESLPKTSIFLIPAFADV